MKRYLNKTIILLIVIITSFFSCTFYVQGASIDNSQTNTLVIEETNEPNSFITLLNDGVLYIGQLIEEVLAEVVGSGLGKVSPSIDSIIFNEYPITRIDYFRKNVEINKEYNNFGIQLKEAVSYLYSIEVATIITIYIFFLVYIGIKIIALSIAEQKAKYKESLSSWLIGLLMLLSFHFIMGYIIEINDVLIDFARNIVEKSSNTGTMVLQNLVNKFKEQAFMTENVVKAIIWLVLLFKTLGILFKYLKRLITITILILVFPFVTLGYVLDKLKGGKSKIFDIWFSAFLQNVFINFIDAIIYLIVVQVALDATMDTLLIPVIAILIFDNISDGIAKLIGINKNEYLSPIKTTSIISQNNKGLIKDLKENISNLNKKEKEEKDKNISEINAINSQGKYDSKINNLMITSEKQDNNTAKNISGQKTKNNSKIDLVSKTKMETSSVDIKVEDVLNEQKDVNVVKTIEQHSSNVVKKDINSVNTDIKNISKDNNIQNGVLKNNVNNLNKSPINNTPKIEIADILPKIKVNTQNVNVKVNTNTNEVQLLDALRFNSEKPLNIENTEKVEDENEKLYEQDEKEKYSIDNVLKKAGIDPEALTQEEKIEIYKKQISSYNEIKKDAKVEMRKKQRFNKKA